MQLGILVEYEKCYLIIRSFTNSSHVYWSYCVSGPVLGLSDCSECYTDIVSALTEFTVKCVCGGDTDR